MLPNPTFYLFYLNVIVIINGYKCNNFLTIDVWCCSAVS